VRLPLRRADAAVSAGATRALLLVHCERLRRANQALGSSRIASEQH
jgi:hypothetical protein